MQLKEIILYGKNGKFRRLPFNLGTVNIITGKSKSGKSAVSDIIDYCLGGSSCNIADGVVRDNVAWYGLLIQLDGKQVFVARKNPEPGQQTTGACYYEVGNRIEISTKSDFESNINVESLEAALSQQLGIIENLNKPDDEHTRLPLSANIRHALFFCFQNQDEIAAKNFLFHKQSEDFISQAIKDTLPYFLGIVDEQFLALENKRVRLQRELVREKKKFEEQKAIRGGGLDRATSLIAEAKQVGLLNADANVDFSDYISIQNIFREILDWEPNAVSMTHGMDRLSYLQSLLNSCHTELEEIEDNLLNAKSFAGETDGYRVSVVQQKVRLESIGLFEQLSFDEGKCPFCDGELASPLPGIEKMKDSIVQLEESINSVTKERPKLRKYIDELETIRQKKREEIENIRNEIIGIYHQKQESQKIKDFNSRKAKVVGRVSLWMESVIIEDFGDQEKTIKTIEIELSEINNVLDKDSLEERKQSALSRIQVDMTNWAKELELEHSENPYRLDLNKVTVIVDKVDRPVPLKQLGSGSNWVGVHLITYFALQKFFINANRPVPQFLFLDQPSQVYFPSELDEKNTDWEKVSKMYQFIFDRVKELNGKLQVIIVDHAANLSNEEFASHIVENWHGEDNLIPLDWLE